MGYKPVFIYSIRIFLFGGKKWGRIIFLVAAAFFIKVFTFFSSPICVFQMGEVGRGSITGLIEAPENALKYMCNGGEKRTRIY